MVKRFDRIDKIIKMNKMNKMNKIILHANRVNPVNLVNPVQSSFSPHAACGLDGDTKVNPVPIRFLSSASYLNCRLVDRRRLRLRG